MIIRAAMHVLSASDSSFPNALCLAALQLVLVICVHLQHNLHIASAPQYRSALAWRKPQVAYMLA